jgi:hypothetical protein
VDATALLARARSALGRGTPYLLGGDGDPTLDRLPATGVDCSGFVLWALRHPGPDMETSGIVSDATGAQLFFTLLPASPRPGCLIVYPDYTAQVFYGQKPQHHEGHVGIVTEVALQGGKPVVRSVIHCSKLLEVVRTALQPGSPPDAILETGPAWFPYFNAIPVWYRAITD